MGLPLMLLAGLTVPAQVAPSEIVDQVNAFVATINTHDTAAVVEWYTDHAAVSSLGDGQITVGRVPVTFLLADFIGPGVRFSVDSIQVHPLGSNAAVATMRYEAGYPNAAASRGAMSIVFVRTPRGWKIANDHTSTLVEGSSGGGLAMAGGGPPGPVRSTRICELTSIVDGDTIGCRGVGRIRLIGMDTPESGQEPFASLATEALASLLNSGSVITLEPDVESQDRYNRALRYVWVDGVQANWWLVRNGWAVVLTYPPNVQYVDWFTQAQEQAREEGQGLWSMGGFNCLPRERRRGRC